MIPCHRGEDYKLFWPEKAEFIRLAVASGAIIVPFSAIGVADRYALHVEGGNLSWNEDAGLKWPCMARHSSMIDRSCFAFPFNYCSASDGELGGASGSPSDSFPMLLRKRDRVLTVAFRAVQRFGNGFIMPPGRSVFVDDDRFDSLEMVLDGDELLDLPIIGDRLRKSSAAAPSARGTP